MGQGPEGRAKGQGPRAKRWKGKRLRTRSRLLI